MGLLSDFILADASEAVDFRSIDSLRHFPILDASDVDPLILAELWCILEGGEPLERVEHFTLLHEESAEEWVYAVPEELLALVSALEEKDTAETVRLWVEEEEMKGVDVSAAYDFIQRWQKFIKRGQDEGKRMLLRQAL